MSKFSYKKNLAFTLAEMMVVLTIFSVISAATLPVITARQQLPSGVDGAEVDAWKLNTDYNSLSYYNAGSLAHSSAVMVGGQITESAKDLGYPQLIVTDSYGNGTGSQDASQIILLKRNNSTPYYAGRIMMGNDVSLSRDSIAIGSNAMSFNTAAFGRSHNTVIGSNAVAPSGTNSSILRSIAIGPYALNQNGYIQDYIAIGNYAAYSNIGSNSVVIGNHAAYSVTGAKTMNNCVAIGNYVVNNKSASSILNTIALGNYAGYGSTYKSDVIAVGYYADADIYNNQTYSKVAIGSYAGALSIGRSYKGIHIGNYAGYYATYVDNDVFIGENAGSYSDSGYSVSIGRYSSLNAYNNMYYVSIGTRAGMNNYASWASHTPKPVAIGTKALARYNKNITVDAYDPAVVMGFYAGYAAYGANMSYSILIGSYAGYLAKDLYNTVCIGNKACRKAVGGSNLVRISSKGTRYTILVKNVKTNQSHIGDVPLNVDLLLSNDEKWYEGTNYDTLLITPLYANLTTNTDSSIVLFGDVFSAKNNLVQASDKRLKENIRPAKYGLKDIRKINVYNYTWKNDEKNIPQIGVIAQELQKIIPESVHKTKEGYLSVTSTWFIYALVNAIKDLDSQVQNIQNNVVAYAKEYVSLVQQVNKLETEVKILENENKLLVKKVEIATQKVKK